MNRFKVWVGFNLVKNFISSFHIAIIASLLLTATFSGCGYKTNPVYVAK